MKPIKVGKYVIPLWLIALLLVSGFGSGLVTYYVWTTLTIPVEVKEPLEVLSYPSQLKLFAGETIDLKVTVVNHASITYSVLLDFSLNNASYQKDYVTFSNEIYSVTSGQRDLTAKLSVKPNAPPTNAVLTVAFKRGVYPSGLVGYWSFDEGSGTIASDSSGNNNNGILMNGPAWVEGKYGKALHLDGTNDYVFIGSSSSLEFSEQITVACWTKVESSTGDHQVIVAQNYGYSNIFGIEFQPDGRTPQFFVGISSGNRQYAVSNLVVQFGEWTHLVGIFDGSVVKIYVNGILRGTTALSGSVNVVGKPVQLGAHTEPSDRNWFKGTIDEVMVYNRALSAEEVTIQYSSSP